MHPNNILIGPLSRDYSPTYRPIPRLVFLPQPMLRRKGAALHGAHKWSEAIAAYEDGIAIEDSPALQKGLNEVKQAQSM